MVFILNDHRSMNYILFKKIYYLFALVVRDYCANRDNRADG